MNRNSTETAQRIAREHDATSLRHAGIVDAIAKAIEDARQHHARMYLEIVERFDKDPIAIQFLREDGEGGFGAGIYRMAREIERLWKQCGEPPTRDPRWQDEEDERVDAEIQAQLTNRKAAEAGGVN